MKNIKRILTAFLLTLCIALSFSLSSSAIAKEARLSDEASLLTEAQAAAIEAKLDQISESYSQDIVIVTTDSLNGMTPRDFAEKFYTDKGYGFNDSCSGIILLISMEFGRYYREYYILPMGEAENIFGESELDLIENAILDHLTENDFEEAFSAFADKCGYVIKYDKRLTPIWILISLLAGVLAAAFVISKMISQHKGVKMQAGANNYMQRDTFRLDRSRDVFLYSHVTRVPKPQNNPQSRSGGGRSGGRGGKF